MILKAFAFLSATPIHEKSEGHMHSRNCDQHGHGDWERGYTSKESEDGPQPAEELRLARKASGAGMCIVPVKNPMVPEKPKPPNQPNIF